MEWCANFSALVGEISVEHLISLLRSPRIHSRLW